MELKSKLILLQIFRKTWLPCICHVRNQICLRRNACVTYFAQINLAIMRRKFAKNIQKGTIIYPIYDSVKLCDTNINFL